MAGSAPGFGLAEAAAFRTGIRFVFDMSAPNLDADKIKFHFASVVTNATPADGDGIPFDPAAAPTKVTPAPVSVSCGIEYLDAADQPTAFGTVIPAKAKITLLDQDYQLVSNAAYIVLGGEKFTYHRTQKPDALFSVDVHTMIFLADNQR